MGKAQRRGSKARPLAAQDGVLNPNPKSRPATPFRGNPLFTMRKDLGQCALRDGAAHQVRRRARRNQRGAALAFRGHPRTNFYKAKSALQDRWAAGLYRADASQGRPTRFRRRDAFVGRSHKAEEPELGACRRTTTRVHRGARRVSTRITRQPDLARRQPSKIPAWRPALGARRMTPGTAARTKRSTDGWLDGRRRAQPACPQPTDVQPRRAGSTS